ncbi:uncharacterized protein LOC100378911 [Saccoglossus kowalevskii]|uniref:Probable GPI-anchored adhesin-like protein PGA55-like n=1 Tax=Saccoglossus kowalevskii TaxID=10224 RepID=A0ABM0GQP3_SACKO|nr:PREDICTED: probable GPI-anchored adhesin-like protein PGA55-like [Saccoglossus kowalevskii]
MSIREVFPARKRRYSYAEKSQKTPRSGRRTRSAFDRAVGRSPWNDSMNASIDGEPEITWDNNTPSPRRCTRLATKIRKRDANATNVSEIVRRITSTSSDVTCAKPSTPTLLNVWMNKDDEGGSSTRRTTSLSSMQTPIRRRNKRKVNGRPIGVRSSQVTKYMNKLIEEAEAQDMINNEDDNIFQEKPKVGNDNQETALTKNGEVILAIDSEEEDEDSEKQKNNNNDSIELFEKVTTEVVHSEVSEDIQQDDSCKYEGGGENADVQSAKLGKRKSNSPDPLLGDGDDLWDDDDLYCDDSFLRQATQIEIQCSQIADSIPVKIEDFSKNSNVVASTPLVHKAKSVIDTAKMATGSTSRILQKLKETESKPVKTRQFGGTSVKVNQFAVKNKQQLPVASKPALSNPPRLVPNTRQHTATRDTEGPSNPQSLPRRPLNIAGAVNNLLTQSAQTSVNSDLSQRMHVASSSHKAIPTLTTTAPTTTKSLIPAKNFTVPSSQVCRTSNLAIQCASKQFSRAFSPHKAHNVASTNPSNPSTRTTRNNSSSTLGSTKSYPHEYNGKANCFSKTNQLTTTASGVNMNDPVCHKNLMKTANSEYDISLTSDELLSLIGQDDSWDIDDTVLGNTNEASGLKTNQPELLYNKAVDPPVSSKANTKMQQLFCSVKTNTQSGTKQIVHGVTGSHSQTMNLTENKMTESSRKNVGHYTLPVKNTGSLSLKANSTTASKYNEASKLAANSQKAPTRMTLRSSSVTFGTTNIPTIPKDTLMNKTSGLNTKPLGDCNKTLVSHGMGNNARNSSRTNQFMNAHSVKSSGSSGTTGSESSGKLSSSQGEKTCSQRYTPEEIERKKLEALKRRQERQQSSQESSGRSSQCSSSSTSTQSRKYNFKHIKNGPK